MTNAQLIKEAIQQGITHPLLGHALTPRYLTWLDRPCQLPIPFPSLGPESTRRLLDMALADWQNFHREKTPYHLP